MYNRMRGNGIVFLVCMFIGLILPVKAFAIVYETILAEDFEGDTSGWSETGEYKMWCISDAVAHGGEKSAYVCDRDGNAKYNAGRSLLEISLDLRMHELITLGFWWKWQGEAQDYGEVYIYDETYDLVSKPHEFYGSPDWTYKEIDLSEYRGKQVRLCFYWNADWITASDPGFCIDEENRCCRCLTEERLFEFCDVVRRLSSTIVPSAPSPATAVVSWGRAQNLSFSGIMP